VSPPLAGGVGVDYPGHNIWLYPDFPKPFWCRNQYRRVVEGSLPNAKWSGNLIRVIAHSIIKKNNHQQDWNCVAPCGGFLKFFVI
jgi:hypothetical protein